MAESYANPEVLVSTGWVAERSTTRRPSWSR